MAKKLTKNNIIGALGEDIAQMFLMKHGFSIITRNYWKKWGEIDIIAQKGNILHFVEVKSVSCEKISRETTGNPADNIHPRKLQRLGRVIQSYLLENVIDQEWQLDALLVYIDESNREAKVEVIHNIII